MTAPGEARDLLFARVREYRAIQSAIRRGQPAYVARSRVADALIHDGYISLVDLLNEEGEAQRAIADHAARYGRGGPVYDDLVARRGRVRRVITAAIAAGPRTETDQ